MEAARPSDGAPKCVIIFLPDVFGWELSNSRLLADIYPKEGCLLYLPNFMKG